MLKLRKIQFASWFCCAATLVTPLIAHSQSAPAASPPLALHAVLVLTPEFCATKFSQGSIWTTGKEKFAVGKEACKDLEAALKPVFSALTIANATPTSGDAQVILTPKFTNGHATTSAFAFSNREMDVLLEWTVKDSAGKTLWLATVQGSAKRHEGNLFTHGHDVKLITANSVEDVAEQSAAKMRAAPELREFAENGAKAAE